MTSEQLLALASRVEAATGPDRELDALIWCALRGVRYVGHNPAYAPYGRDNPETQVEFTEPPRRTRVASGGAGYPHAQPVTASLDAAIALGDSLGLMPVGMSDIIMDGLPGVILCSDTSTSPPKEHSGVGEGHDGHIGPLARAYTAAALRAAANMEGE